MDPLPSMFLTCSYLFPETLAPSVNVWDRQSHQCRWPCFGVPVLFFMSMGHSVRLVPSCLRSFCPSWTSPWPMGSTHVPLWKGVGVVAQGWLKSITYHIGGAGSGPVLVSPPVIEGDCLRSVSWFLAQILVTPVGTSHSGCFRR